MEPTRRPFQGVLTIIRFNWHFYVIAGLLLVALITIGNLFPQPVQHFIFIMLILISLPIVVSLLASFYIYDLSDLYELKWLGDCGNQKILTINAGFDETSEIIKRKFTNVDLTICDFYDPVKHTEISIRRARKVYPPNPQIISVRTDVLPFADNTFDRVIAILSAHEIRDKKERDRFFKELYRITKVSGQIVITEHLRDLPNFLAYTIGFLHFHSKKSWIETFQAANLSVKQEVKMTPFITTFILEKNGNTH